MSRLGDLVRDDATPDELRTTARDMRQAHLVQHAHEGQRALNDFATRLADFRAATPLGPQADDALAIIQALASDLATRYGNALRKDQDGAVKLRDAAFDPTRELMAAVKTTEGEELP